ncbi:MAG: energy transducer TonB [Phaeodactylibacter sp.]|nr:energy transducer TonB [Phaeodactylibacter sp.]MCB9276119.1 energy transducer TonB [Lewinellaceae bacterium]
MPKEKKDKHFIKKPIYPGGPRAMKAFIGQNMQYPPEALSNKVEGTVYINYTIDYQGKVTDAKVIAGLGHGCDEEAARLVRLLQFEVPKARGVKVQFHNDIQIHFRLPRKKAAPAKPSGTLQYSYTEKKKERDTETKGKGQSGGYSYTITLPG